MKLCAFFDGNAIGFEIAVDPRGMPDLYALRAGQFALHATTHDNFSCGYVGLDVGVGTDGHDRLTEGNYAFDLTVNEKILIAVHFPLDLNALTHAGRGLRRHGEVGRDFL